MFELLLFFTTAVVGTYLIASGVVTTALGVSLAFDRAAQKPVAGAAALICEMLGVALSIAGIVGRFKYPDGAHHAMIVGGLLIALGALLAPDGAVRREPLLHRVKLGQYAGAGLSVLALMVFYSFRALAG